MGQPRDGQDICQGALFVALHMQTIPLLSAKLRWRPNGKLILQGSTENAALENEGQKWDSGMKYVDRKMQDRKMQDWNLEDNFARLENAVLENAGQKTEDPEMNHRQVS